MVFLWYFIFRFHICYSYMDTEDHWFSFNDSHVLSINSTDIESQFSGKKSAYMLFYRQKKLHRQKDGKTDAQIFQRTKLLIIYEMFYINISVFLFVLDSVNVCMDEGLLTYITDKNLALKAKR